MSIPDKLHASATAFVVGVIGDLLLNKGTRMGVLRSGLLDYFNMHGIFESTMIAGGLMASSTWVAMGLSPATTFKQLVLFMTLFGFGLDLMFRYGNLMPSLRGMYDTLKVFTSMLWAAGPLVFSLVITPR